MAASLVPFIRDHAEAAAQLFIESYERERSASPLLPSRVIDGPAWIAGALETKLGNPGMALVEADRVLAYLLTGDQFEWKGQSAAIVLEYCHASVSERQNEFYQRLYMALSQEWADHGIHLHLIRHFANDLDLQETLYQLGFGAILAERLRDCSAIDRPSDVAVRIEQDMGRLVALHTEHNRFYPRAPIFISKPTGPQDVRAGLDAHAAQGDVVFVCDEGGEPAAYMIVGESSVGEGQGFLLERTNSAEIKSAFARPEVRGTGVGAALLQRAIGWARERGYERVFVEHETANVLGGNFWRAHFAPFLHSSMRYIDPTLAA